MKFICEQERLNRIVSVVSRAVARGTGVLPIATNIRLSTEDGRIRLDATNLTIGITAWMPGTVTEEGSVALPAKLLTDIVGALSPGKLTLTMDASTFDVQIEGMRGRVHLRGVSAEEFPPMPTPTLGVQPTLLKSSLLKEVVRDVSIAAADLNGGTVFSNILVQLEKQHITFAAADGYGKLAYRTVPLAAESVLTTDILVPASALTDIASILPTEGMAEMQVTPSQILIQTPEMILSSILATGTYPNYKKTLPTERQTRLTVNTEALREIVRLTAPFAKSDFEAAHFTITPSKGMEPGTLTIRSEAPDIGGNCNTIAAAVEGETQEALVFNAIHLAKVLGVMTAPEIILEIGITRAPVGVLRATGLHTCVYSFSSMNVTTR